MPSGLDIHDALICATVLVGQDVLREEVRLITRDEVLVQAGLVQTIW